jgi:ADP-ribose pyrophosphatase
MDRSEKLRWITLGRTTLFEGPIFDVISVERQAPDGRVGSFIEVDAPQWATVIPWFRDEEGVPHFIMVKQYRHGSDQVTIEFPAGTVDPGEDPLVAALRELREETGYVPTGEVSLIGEISPNPAFMNNRALFFLVEGVEKVGGQELDPNEQLDILKIPVSEVVDSMGYGLYDNGIMMIAQGYFMRYALERGDLLS